MRHLLIFILLGSCILFGAVGYGFYPQAWVLYPTFLPVPILMVNQVFWVKYIAETKAAGELAVKRVGRKFRYTSLIIASLWTLTWLAGAASNMPVMPFMFWVLVFFEITTHVALRKYKPVGLVVDGNYFYDVYFFTTKRNLKNLREIQFTRFYKTVIMRFEKQPSIRIVADDFNKEDLNILLGLAISKSNYAITLPGNLQRFLETRVPVAA